ncbi:hypothetical protein HYE82_05740 [Streptomyces sp. BR123]|uniref:protein DpdD n=1 Tax=Streptomyces sp. BR123 TaxID=2749828 RepID=UPI0015C4DB01|nr:protein DpdD [Streptomyces sp. BR123]NXY93902.1 hypothetical protein [Streptomyces sp. BR123]
MTQAQQQTREDVEKFLQRFFGPGNRAWPGLDAEYRHKDRSMPFVEALRRGDDAPIVLPRAYADRDRFAMYVIARDQGDRSNTAELIRAFAGPTYVAYEEQVGIQPVRLDPDDPVERALLDFAGDRPIFRLDTGRTLEHRGNLADVLLLMQKTVASRPPRLWRVAKPIGRLLAEFDASLAAGAEAASSVVLDHLAAAGGVTATNLANLRIKRLDRLGRSREILSLPELADVVSQNPPAPVKEAILNAVYAALEGPLAENDLSAAQELLVERGRFVPDLLDISVDSLGPQAITVLLMAATVLDDVSTLHRLVEAVQHADRADELSPLVWDDSRRALQGRHEETADNPQTSAQLEPTAEEAAQEATVAHLPVDSWQSLLAAVTARSSEGKLALENRSWMSWPSPATEDAALAAFLDGLENHAAEEAWRAVGAFIDAVGYEAPAGLTAHAFIRNAVTFDRFGPGDLAVLQALTEIALRAAPSARTYTDLLDEIGAERGRWVSPERAPIALDFVDRLFLAACPNTEARSNLAYALLEPLWLHQQRLERADWAFAQRLSRELDIAFEWEPPAGDGDQGESPSEIPPLTLLLYSLDEAVLARCREEVGRLAPAVKVTTASDHVGTPQLRQKARTADVIVLATRCAKHAATGFIDQHAVTEHIGYANGSGSASLLRAAVDKLRAAAAASS